jgi:hypothetical protein
MPFEFAQAAVTRRSAGVLAGWLGCVSLPTTTTLEFRW